MTLRGVRRRHATDRGFVISDHADWPGLLEAIKNTGAENVYVTHGYSNIFAQHLSNLGWNAKVLQTEFGAEIEEETS
jgi:putative mRNA 3-end processing factor